jgi:hypothetical protein
MNSRYRSIQRMTINWDAIIASPVPYPIERTPQEEIERLEAAISDEDETIRSFGSSRIALDAKGRIAHYELEIEKWQAAIYVAEQEAFDRVMWAAANGYASALFTARRADYLRRVHEIVGGAE